MALSRSHPNDIPKDAVVISEEQALTYQWKVISTWEKSKEVWALRYGPPITALMTAATSMFVNSHFRTKLKLGRYGQMSTYLPIVVIPAMLSLFSHKVIIQRSVILDSLSQCPLCLQFRAAAFQIGTGTIYPMLLAPLSSFMMATRYFTYRLPSITDKPQEVLQLWRKLTRPILPTMGIILAGQSILTMYITYKEMEQNLHIQIALKKLEKQYEQDHPEFALNE